MFKTLLNRICLLCSLFVLFPSPAHAYLDPGTGSLILQGLIAGLVAVAAFWQRIRNGLSKLLGKKDKSK